MDYNLLICAGDKQWVAIDINTDGDCDRISFDGNEFMAVESSEAVTDFCAQILNYYNINSFNDIELIIKIVVISEYSNLIEDLFLQMKGAKSINVIDSKSIIPIYVLKNCIVKSGGMIDVRCLEKKFTLQVDDSLVVSYVSDKAGEEIVMEPECFSILFRFDCKNLISDETELKALEEKYTKDIEKKKKEVEKKQTEVEKKQTEIENQKILYSELKKKYDELENYHKFDDKRTILRFNTYPFKQFISHIEDKYRHSLLSLPSCKYICKFLKTDGDIVTQGTKLIEISASFTGIAGVCLGTETRFIEAKEDGRIFYLVKNGAHVKDQEAVVLISDPADKRTDIMKWYNEMK